MYKVCEYVFCLPSNWQYDAERGEGERELERYGCSEKYVGVCFFMYTVFQVHVHVHVATCTCTHQILYMEMVWTSNLHVV